MQPGDDDIDYLLDAVNAFFGTELGRADVTGAYAGVRPLISTGDPRKSVDISRKAELYETSSGMLTITGGKLTTWRRMAKQVVDRMVEREGRVAPCRTDDIPLGMAARPSTSSTRPTGLTEADLPAGYRELLGLPLRPRGAQRARGWRRAARSSRRRSSTGSPTCSPRRDRRPLRAGALGRRRAPAPDRLGLLAAPQLRTRRVGRRRSRERWATSSAGTRRGSAPRPSAGSPTRAAEGIDPAAGVTAG